MRQRKPLRPSRSRPAETGWVPPELLVRAWLEQAGPKVGRQLRPGSEPVGNAVLEVGEVEHFDGIEHIDYDMGFEVSNTDAGDVPARVSVFEIGRESDDDFQA